MAKTDRKLIYDFNVLAVAVSLALLTAPGCTIRLGPGTDGTGGSGRSDDQTEQADPMPSDTVDAQPPQPNQEATPEEMKTAADALAQVDPQELALASAKAGYAAYFVQGSIESLGLDPNTLDDATLSQLIEQYMPQAMNEANNWALTADTSNLPIPENPRWDCHRLYGCPSRVHCVRPTWDAFCFATDCDEAKCRPCPDIFNLSNLLIKSWCAYVCIDGRKTVGIAATVMSHWRTEPIGPFCVQL
jgi:hypothetical protein